MRRRALGAGATNPRCRRGTPEFRERSESICILLTSAVSIYCKLAHRARPVVDGLRDPRKSVDNVGERGDRLGRVPRVEHHVRLGEELLEDGEAGGGVRANLD